MNKTDSIVLGGGCFWCLDAVYHEVKGVLKSECGYSGGTTTKPTYEKVSSGSTGYAEVVEIEFDPQVISLKDVLNIFWTMHDPTSLNRQGADVGPQYRSVIFYKSEMQKQIIADSKKAAQKLFDKPIVTKIEPLNEFYLAEEEHQNYFNKNPYSGYCQVVINPKLTKLKTELSRHLK